MSGSVLGGRYELGPLLGRGGMAEVYRARDTVLDRDVAVKRFRAGSVPSEDLRRTGEVRLLAGLSHPGLVTVFDAGRGEDGPDDPFAYLVMELVEGTTLRPVIDAGPVPPDRVTAIGTQLADALAHVHARGIVHRDIKPANILIAADGTAKLTDFGVARLLDSTRLTVDGMTVGTPNYLSPEQTTGAPVTASSDVYSFALVLLECLTGAVAFPGHGVEAAVVRLHRDPVVPERLGAPWVDLLRRMTARDPVARPTAAEVATALRAGATAPLPVADATTVFEPVATAPRRSRWLPMAIGATVAAIAALAAVLAFSAGGDPSTTPGSPATPTSTPRTSAVARSSSTVAPSPSTTATSRTPSTHTPSTHTVATPAPPAPPGNTKPGKPGKSKPGKPGKGHGKP